MKKFLVAIITVLWGSSVQAQSKEELLPICIEESQEIIKFAQAFRSGVSSIGETMRPSAFASMVLAPEEKKLLEELLLKSIAADADPKNIELELSSGFARLETKRDLISDMLEEAFEESLEFEQMSLFIAGCTNAFGDEVYTLQEKVDELSEENEAADRKLKATEKALEIAKAGSNKSRSQLNIALETQRKTEEKLQKSEAALSNFVTANKKQINLIKDAEDLLDGVTANQSVDAFREQIAAALAAKMQAERTLKFTEIDARKTQERLAEALTDIKYYQAQLSLTKKEHQLLLGSELGLLREEHRLQLETVRRAHTSQLSSEKKSKDLIIDQEKAATEKLFDDYATLRRAAVRTNLGAGLALDRLVKEPDPNQRRYEIDNSKLGNIKVEDDRLLAICVQSIKNGPYMSFECKKHLVNFLVEEGW